MYKDININLSILNDLRIRYKYISVRCKLYSSFIKYLPILIMYNNRRTFNYVCDEDLKIIENFFLVLIYIGDNVRLCMAY